MAGGPRIGGQEGRVAGLELRSGDVGSGVVLVAGLWSGVTGTVVVAAPHVRAHPSAVTQPCPLRVACTHRPAGDPLHSRALGPAFLRAGDGSVTAPLHHGTRTGRRSARRRAVARHGITALPDRCSRSPRGWPGPRGAPAAAMASDELLSARITQLETGAETPLPRAGLVARAGAVLSVTAFASACIWTALIVGQSTPGGKRGRGAGSRRLRPSARPWPGARVGIGPSSFP